MTPSLQAAEQGLTAA